MRVNKNTQMYTQVWRGTGNGYNFNHANFQEGDLYCIHIRFHGFKFSTKVETPSHHLYQQKLKKKN